MAAQIVGKRIDPIDHFTRKEWASLLRRAQIVTKVRKLASYTTGEFLSILTAAEGQSDGR